MSKNETTVATSQQNGSPQQPSNLPEKEPKRVSDITDIVLEKVQNFQALGELRMPKDYSPENALKSAYLILTDMEVNGKPVLQHCTKESIANSLLNMVVQGLSPMKKQGAFIAYGNKLQWQIEYHGTVALAKRFGGVKDVIANVIYDGDVFEYTIDPATGRKRVVKHDQSFENIDMNKIKGAYATLILSDGSSFIEIMNMNQIRQAWNQGASKGNSPAHKNFPDQMAIKTVINRACKLFISTSDDSSILSDDDIEDVNAEVISTKANKQIVDFNQPESEAATQEPNDSQDANDPPSPPSPPSTPSQPKIEF